MADNPNAPKGVRCQLTQSRLKEVVCYDPASGVFTWAMSRPACRKGAVCGRINGNGYREIGIDGVLHGANRLAVLYMTGAFPPDAMVVDHRNRNKTDDRWLNLRVCTQWQNTLNASKGTDRLKGVTWDKARSKWRAQVRIDGAKVNLGRFDCFGRALSAYRSAAKAAHGEYFTP